LAISIHQLIGYLIRLQGPDGRIARTIQLRGDPSGILV
jgi:hypothetical protein